MKITITLQDLLRQYKESDSLFICYTIRKILKSSGINYTADAILSDQVRQFFNQFFVQNAIQEHEVTLPLWYFNRTESGQLFVRTTGGVNVYLEKQTATRNVRIFMMEYILANYPEARITLEIRE